MKDRNISLELYRCGLMFGICLLHAIVQGGHNTAWAANSLQWCVSAFVFISGWFGIRFSFAKLIKLYGISFYCAATFVGVDSLITGQWGGACMCLDRIWKIAIGLWFLNAYAVLMCFAPILNQAIESAKGKKVVAMLAPLFMVAFGWSFATTLPIVPKWIPSSTGLTAYSFLTLIGVYALARALRVAGVEELGLPRWVKVGVFVFCLVAAAIGLGDYNSPFAIGLALLSFYWAKGYNSRVESVERVVGWLGPSIFSVYLIHSNGQAWGYVKAIENGLLGAQLPLGVVYGLTASIIFCACVVLDLPRRVIGRLIER